MDYRAAVAPYLESIRRERTTPRTLKDYTDRLNTAIDFLEQRGGSEITEDYYAALEENLIAGGLAASTVKGRISLARRFFAHAAKQEGDRQIPMNECVQESSEEGRATQEAPAEEETVQVVEEPAPHPPLLSSVEAEEQTEPELPQGGGAVQEGGHRVTGRPRKSPEGRSRKLTLYLTPALDDDVKDLARIQRLSTPDYIFRLIERERDRRADALAAFRALEEE